MSANCCLLVRIWRVFLRPLCCPVPIRCVEYDEVMQLVIQPSVLVLRSILFVDNSYFMLSVVPKVGFIAIRTLVLLQ